MIIAINALMVIPTFLYFWIRFLNFVWRCCQVFSRPTHVSSDLLKDDSVPMSPCPVLSEHLPNPTCLQEHWYHRLSSQLLRSRIHLMNKHVSIYWCNNDILIAWLSVRIHFNPDWNHFWRFGIKPVWLLFDQSTFGMYAPNAHWSGLNVH